MTLVSFPDLTDDVYLFDVTYLSEEAADGISIPSADEDEEVLNYGSFPEAPDEIWFHTPGLAA